MRLVFRHVNLILGAVMYPGTPGYPRLLCCLDERAKTAQCSVRREYLVHSTRRASLNSLLRCYSPRIVPHDYDDEARKCTGRRVCDAHPCTKCRSLRTSKYTFHGTKRSTLTFVNPQSHQPGWSFWTGPQAADHSPSSEGSP